MKKLICLLSASLLVLASCSGDDPTPTNSDSDNVLLKKTIETDGDGNTFITNFTYDGNKLTGYSDSDGGHTVITYTGDLITKEEIFDYADVLIEKFTYQYNADNQLTTFIFLDYQDTMGEKFTYTHNNSDGTISYQLFNGDLTSQTEFLYDGKIYANKIEENETSPVIVDTHTYTYDGKNNPFKNVLGWDKISFAGTDEGTNFSENTVSTTHSNSLGLSEVTYNNTYTYNSSNFPVTEVETNHSTGSADQITTFQFFYE